MSPGRSFYAIIKVKGEFVMKFIELKCKKCGGEIKVKEGEDKVVCEYCHTENMIDDAATELKRVEDAKLRARVKNHEQDIKEQTEQDDKEEVKKFKKSKFSKVLLIFLTISILYLFISSRFLSKMLTLIQIVLFLSAWLMGMHIIKEKYKGIHTIVAVVAFALIIPIINTNSSSYDSTEKINWNNIVLHEVIPKPDGNKGKIYTNSDSDLSVYITKQSKDDYVKYVNACQNLGFNIDVENQTNSFTAFNNEGYKLYIYYTESSKEYHIDLDAPEKFEENIWPNNVLSNMLPKPTSSKGKILSDTSTSFAYMASATSKDDFKEYINALKDYGFNKDYNSQDKNYSAKNENGYSITVTYVGANVMKIALSAPQEDQDNKNNAEVKEEIPDNNDKNNYSDTNNTSTTSGIRPDFKKAMDSYEKFIDEYISFMKKYESNPSDLKLLKEYSSYMTKYNKFLKDFEEWDSKDLNKEEEKYYLDVQNRVNKKLIDISM